MNVKKDFLDLTRSVFQSESSVLDFSKSGEAAKLANDWVAKKTHNKITELLTAGNLFLNQINLTKTKNKIKFKKSYFFVLMNFYFFGLR